MFERILALFGKTDPEPLPEPDARLALGALLVRIAKADRAYLFEEVAQIDRILAIRNDLTVVEAAKMRATCEKLKSQMPSTPEVTEMICKTTSCTEREATIDALWQVALADGITPEVEKRLIATVSQSLDISPEDSVRLHHAARLHMGM